MKNRNIALVLSGGGARGLAHIGVIEELEKSGYTITSIAGTSMGSLVGGMYAAGQLAAFKTWMCSLDKKAVFDLLDFTVSTNGVIKGERVIDALKKLIADRNIESLPIPYCGVATDFINGKEIVFRSGSLYDCIKASSSIPTLVTPFSLNGLLLVDGGVLNPLPINQVVRTKQDLLVVVNVNANTQNESSIAANGVPVDEELIPENNNEFFSKYLSFFNGNSKKNATPEPKTKPEHLGYFEVMVKSLNLMMQRNSELTIELYKPDILISISKNSYGIYDFHKTAEIIEEGARVAKEVLDKETAFHFSLTAGGKTRL